MKIRPCWWLGVCLLVSCASEPTRVQHYTLHAVSPSGVSAPASEGFQKAVGVGPITLPGALERVSVVSFGAGQRMNIASHAQWSEPLATLLPRVITNNISASLGVTNVLAHPWGITHQPDIRVPIMIQQLAGPLGGDVVLHARWRVLASNAEPGIVYQGHWVQATETESMDSYVKAINLLVNQLSEAVSSSLPL